MWLPILGIVAGLALLTYAADQFVIGAARVSVALKLSTVVIGAVVIGFGTSAPEMVVSGIAAGSDKLDIAAGNIIGSNVANLSLVLGAAALVTAITVESPTLKREAPISLAATLLFAFFIQDGLTRAEGVMLAVALAAGLYVILKGTGGEDPAGAMSGEVEEFLGEGEEHPLVREAFRTLGGLIGVLIAAQTLVWGATSIAAEIGLAEGFVGLTIVAIGTSLPELATSLQAARKNETDLIVGNLLGSNLFNSAGVGAVAALAGPGMVEDPNLTGLGVYLMVGIGFAATAFMVTGQKVVRWEGMALLIGYVTVLPLLA